MITARRHRLIKNQVLIGIVSSIGLTCFYFVSQRTNWLAPTPLVCGGWKNTVFVKASTVSGLLAEGVKPRFCVREVLRPYSTSMADVWAGVSIFRPQGETYVEGEFFVAKNFGKERFNDEPGDWMIQRTTRYNRWGIEQWSKVHQVASWYDPMMDSATALQLWTLIQQDVAKQYPHRHISWVRQLNEITPELAFTGFLAFFCYGVYKRLFASPSEANHLQLAHTRQSLQRGLIKELSILILLLSGWSILRWTDWLSHTPFTCSTFRSSLPAHPYPFQICFHEVLSLPDIENQTVVLGASIHTPKEVIRSDMQFYIADGKNKLGFKDQPGDWAFVGYKRYDSRSGVLKSSTDETISSWYDAFVPADVQLQIWKHVRDDIAVDVNARRVSIPRKFTAVLESFAALAAASVITIMTFIKLVEVTVIDVDTN